MLPISLLVLVTTGAQPSVWVTHATVKIRPADAPGTGTSATIKAARNEFEAFQVAVNGGSSGVTGVRATAPSLAGPAGATIPAANVRLYREAFITTQYASFQASPVGRWPDALVPDLDETANEQRNAFPFDVPALENRALWVEVLVPKGAAAGDYHGTLAITGDAGFSASVPVTLTVWAFELPSTASLASTFGQGWDSLCQAYYGGYSSPQCGDAGVVRTHQQLTAFMLDHRLSVDLVYYGPSGSADSYDWASWDKQYAQFFDGTAPTRLSGAKQTLIRYVWKQDQPSYAAWAQHFRAMGWFDRTFDYTCDEPPNGCSWSDITTRAALVHSGDAQFKTLVTTAISDATAQGVVSSIDILAPIINYVDDKPGGDHAGNQRSSYDAFLQNANHRLLWYQSCMSEGCASGSGPKTYDDYFTGWPAMMIDTAALQNRAMEWLSFTYGIFGELYFESTYAFTGGNDAWTNQWFFGGNGDGTLVYPGTPQKIGGTTPVPVASIRLKMIREGMEDYEYLKLVSDLGDPAFAKTQAAKVVTNTYTVTPDPTLLYAARDALAQRILELAKPQCADGTAEGACSTTKPLRCTSGALVSSCQTCGCSAGLTCAGDGTCATSAGPDAGPAGPDAGPAAADAGPIQADASHPSPDASATPGPDASALPTADAAALPSSDAAPPKADASIAAAADASQGQVSSGCQAVSGGPLSLLSLLGLVVLRRRRR